MEKTAVKEVEKVERREAEAPSPPPVILKSSASSAEVPLDFSSQLKSSFG